MKIYINIKYMRKTNFFLHFSKTRGLFFRKIFSVFMQLPHVGLAHSLEWKFRVSTWPLTSPIWLWLLNIYYSYHIQVKGNTWDKLSPLIVIIIAWRSSIKDGILGVGAGGGGGGFSYLPRPWVERTIKTLWIKSVTSSQEKSSRHSKFWGTIRMICV